MEEAWAKASRSRRTEEDCLRAELNREFYKVEIREARALETKCTDHCKKERTCFAAFSKRLRPASTYISSVSELHITCSLANRHVGVYASPIPLIKIRPQAVTAKIAKDDGGR